MPHPKPTPHLQANQAEFERLQKKAQRRIYPMHSWFENSLYYAILPDLPGVMAAGESPQQAFKMLLKAKSRWINQSLRKGEPIPLPNSHRRKSTLDQPTYSGPHKILSPSL